MVDQSDNDLKSSAKRSRSNSRRSNSKQRERIERKIAKCTKYIDCTEDVWKKLTMAKVDQKRRSTLNQNLSHSNSTIKINNRVSELVAFYNKLFSVVDRLDDSIESEVVSGLNLNKVFQ